MTSTHGQDLGEWQEAYDLQATADDFKWFSSSLSKALAIHRKKSKKKKLNVTDRIKLKEAYDVIDIRVKISVPALLKERLSPCEIKAWSDHSVEVLRQVRDDPQWIKTGTMKQYELCCLKAQASLMQHEVPVAMAFETGFFEALVSCIMARRGASNNTLSIEVSNLITFLVGKVVYWCLFSPTLEKQWEPERIFKKFEAIGLLEQFLFCSAISKDKVADLGISFLHGELLKCPVFVGKKFKKGTPCGDTAREILAADHMRTTYHPLATKYLEALVKLSSAMQPNSSNVEVCHCCRAPRPPKDFHNTLMQCSRCRVVSYCSKECQKVAWKKHKKACKCLSKLSKSGPKKLEALIHHLNKFTQANYVHIMKAFAAKCDSSGVQKKDMVLQVSFAPDEDGTIGALQDPPEFSIVRVQNYLDGSHGFDEFFENKDMKLTAREDLESNVLGGLKHQHSSLSSTGLLCLCHHVDGSSLLPIVQEQKSKIYSQEAVDAFQLAMNKNDFGPIAKICCGNDEIMESLRAQLGMPDGENTVPNRTWDIA